jgi:hypothetical protein
MKRHAKSMIPFLSGAATCSVLLGFAMTLFAFAGRTQLKPGMNFFNSHPNPENRIENINLEIRKLGPLASRHINDSSEFRSIITSELSGRSSIQSNFTIDRELEKPIAIATESILQGRAETTTSSSAIPYSGCRRNRHKFLWQCYWQLPPGGWHRRRRRTG